MLFNKNRIRSGQSVIVTGASGFIGSHLVENLVRDGFAVTALVHYNSRSDIGWLNNIDTEIHNSLEIVFGDITDSDMVNKIISGKDLVINLAALIAIPYSYVAPRSYVNTNLIGTLNVCEAVRAYESRLVHISTSEVYGTPQETPITENHNINPQSPYAASKSAADQICMSYFNSFDLKVNIVRPFNTFGPRQSMRAIIPTIINQFISNDGNINIGNLETKRDFTYVTDTVEAVKLVAKEENRFGEIIQLGTGYSYSINEIISLCELISGLKAKIIVDRKRIRPNKSEVKILLSDPSKASKLIKWNYKVPLKEGLEKTYKWYQDNQLFYSESKGYHV